MNWSLRTTAVLALLALLLAALAACGGDDDDDNGGGVFPGSNDDSNGSDSSGDDGEDEDDDDDEGGLPTFGAGGTARLTLGDETFEPILANRTVNGTEQFGFCRVIFGALQIFGYAETDDGRIVEVEMWIPPTDWESYDDDRYDPPQIEIDIEDMEGFKQANWLADQENETFRGNSQIDDYEMEGTSASGTVTFTDEFSREPRPVAQGTFEVECEQ
jgi:hypothetical protein